MILIVGRLPLTSKHSYSRKAQIFEEYINENTYKDLDHEGYECENCGGHARAMKICSIKTEDMPGDIRKKDYNLWVKPHFCFTCFITH